ncbi:MAG: nucleoside phosphorylase [bacterium]|nr:nucleoside phosphorylase [bacterium]
MINDSFDTSKPLFTPKESYGSMGIKPIEKICDKCIVTYSVQVKEDILNKYSNRKVSFTATANGIIDVYYLEELDVLFYMSPVCAPAAVAVLEEISYITGAKNFIFFGSCGILDEKIKNKVIIPTKAYRDEGTSYHYAKANDFIDIKNNNVIESVCINNNIEYKKGYTWTTDAIYRETKNAIEKRKNDGCICVEMETSALEALCNYNGLNLYVFFITGDILVDAWDRADLAKKEEHIKQLSSFDLAILIANTIK